MRPDEEAVLRTLGEALNAEYAEGEDPPDGYLILAGRKIAVEITQMIEQTTRENGESRSRLGEDMPALKVIEQLNDDLSGDVPEDKMVQIILPSPVQDVRRTKKELISVIKDMLGNDDTSRDHDVKNNSISISIFERTSNTQKKIWGAVSNQNSDSDIRKNASIILRDRIVEKEKRRKDSDQFEQYWLVLINQYWISDHETFLNVYKNEAPQHGFDRIYILEGENSICRLC